MSVVDQVGMLGIGRGDQLALAIAPGVGAAMAAPAGVVTVHAGDADPAAVKVDARCEVVTYSGASEGIAASRQRDIVRRATAFVADEVLAPLGYLDPAETPVPTTVPKPTTPDPSSGGATTTTVDEQASGVGDLARTGVNSTGALVRVGLVALALGAGLLLLTRRRRRTDGTGAQGS